MKEKDSEKDRMWTVLVGISAVLLVAIIIGVVVGVVICRRQEVLKRHQTEYAAAGYANRIPPTVTLEPNVGSIDAWWKSMLQEKNWLNSKANEKVQIFRNCAPYVICRCRVATRKVSVNCSLTCKLLCRLYIFTLENLLLYPNCFVQVQTLTDLFSMLRVHVFK